MLVLNKNMQGHDFRYNVSQVYFKYFPSFDIKIKV